MVFLRYGLVAGAAYGVDFGGYVLLIGLGYSPVVANALIKVVAAIFGFFSHRYFTYSITDRSNMGKHAMRYFGLALIYSPVSSALLFGIMFLVSNPIYAKAVSDISLFLLMFWITSKFAFIRTEPGSIEA
jgi:putative flippase GtrA